MSARHRRCVVVRGDRDATAREAALLVGGLASVLQVGAQGARAQLGRSFDAVVMDLHDGVDADVLGQCHGLIRGGGALVLRMPPVGDVPRWAPLALHGYSIDDVGTRFWARLEARVAGHAGEREPLAQPPDIEGGTAEQARVVGALAAGLNDAAPSAHVLVADRGRGKSAALGLALQRVAGRVAVTAASAAAVAELLRFAPAGTRYVEPLELLGGDADVIVVDEAAQLPIALLRELVVRHPRARLAFATTVHGYEGTGRGFALRFVDWLRAQPRPLRELTLREPIRWAARDPLERLVFDLLALDAELAEPGAGDLPPPRVLDRDELARDEPLLRSLFALLVQAHYRTTPNDLQRLLDAPNLAVHAIVDGVDGADGADGAVGRDVLAATLVAREGGLSPAECDELARGRWRIRGHALADTLIVHSGRPDAGAQSIVRSIRIATHPALRRRGLARALIDHVHATYAPDLFGTVFGATPELLRFRRAVGYELVRVGMSRGTRSGEPPAVLLRAGTPRGAALIAELRADLARDLPHQLRWLAAEHELDLDATLAAELQHGLPAPVALSPGELRARLERLLAGPQPIEAAAYAVHRLVAEHPDPGPLLAARVLRYASWRDAAAAAGYPDVPSALRAVRPALRALYCG